MARGNGAIQLMSSSGYSINLYWTKLENCGFTFWICDFLTELQNQSDIHVLSTKLCLCWWKYYYFEIEMKYKRKYFKQNKVKFTIKCYVKVSQSCLTLWDCIEYIVRGILQVRILEWVAIPFSRGSSQPRDRTQVSQLAGKFVTSWDTREAQEYWGG